MKDICSFSIIWQLWASACAWIILCMRRANKRWLYNTSLSLIGWAHTQNDPWCRWSPTPWKTMATKVAYSPYSSILTSALMKCNIVSEYDECLSENHRCDHRCVNTLGGFRCECNIGYELHSDGKRCEGMYLHLESWLVLAEHISGIVLQASLSTNTNRSVTHRNRPLRSHPLEHLCLHRSLCPATDRMWPESSESDREVFRLQISHITSSMY